MSLSHSPSIVKNGLVLAYDAANLRSYDSSENLLLSSQNIGNADYLYTGSPTVTLNTTDVLSPDLFYTSTLVNNLGSQSNYFYSQTQILSANTIYTYSIHVKKGTATTFDIVLDENNFGGQRYNARLTYATETVFTQKFGVAGDGDILSASFTKLSNDWYRFRMTFRTSTTNVGGLVDFVNRYSSSGTNYVWGRQLQTSSVLGTYYATTNAIKTKSTSLFDLSGNDRTGTLVNGTDYNPESGGSLVFDGVNDHVSFSNPLNQTQTGQVWTVQSWINIGSKPSQTLINGLGRGLFIEYAQGNNSLLYLNDGANDYYTYGGQFTNQGWVLSTFRFDNSNGNRQIWRNTTNISTSGPNFTSTPSTQASTFTLGAATTSTISGRVSTLYIYNRYISDNEIINNYNALKGRYGL